MYLTFGQVGHKLWSEGNLKTYFSYLALRQSPAASLHTVPSSWSVWDPWRRVLQHNPPLPKGRWEWQKWHPCPIHMESVQNTWSVLPAGNQKEEYQVVHTLLTVQSIVEQNTEYSETQNNSIALPFFIQRDKLKLSSWNFICIKEQSACTILPSSRDHEDWVQNVLLP